MLQSSIVTCVMYYYSSIMHLVMGNCCQQVCCQHMLALVSRLSGKLWYWLCPVRT